MNDIVRANVEAYNLVDHDDVELADPAVARAYIDQISAMFGDSTLGAFPTNRIPNVCDVVTREPYCRCDQCHRGVDRLFLFMERRVLCRDCAISRVRAGELLAREKPWFLGTGGTP